jgi:prepilin-type N-terminal cleavage/methylation domain-containing protein
VIGRLRPTRSDERGMSLIELVVTTAVLLMFSVMAFNFLVSTNNTASRATKDVQAENDARIALRQMTEDIRAADPITTTYPTSATCPTGMSYPTGFANCVSFTVVHNATSGVSCPKSVITYGLVNGTLKRDDTEYNSSCSVTSSYTGKTVVTSVVNPSGTKLFRFFDSGGNELSASSASSAYSSAASVLVTLVLQYQGGAPNVTVTSTAALRNNRV